jgi:acyl transferase domain-containing protein/NADPH:quinone reductase-like Zn-dependent oxidoreductase/acyl carrier protein
MSSGANEERLRQYLKRVTLELQEAKSQLRDLEASHSEPIAIVGLGCRFPGGVSDGESFWRLLAGGVDTVREIPAERWNADELYDPDPEAAGKTVSRWGSFLEGIEELDAGFFGIAPREAAAMDPQQRLLLETSWEALEDAGIAAESLLESPTGVFMGVIGNEYARRALSDMGSVDAYAMLGGMHSAMVGRISYWLGLRGPNMPVDTACSSSLVAVHLGCQALRNDECNLVLAGGANVALDPESFIVSSRLRALSPTGRCHTFSADGDGFVRSEGAGVVVLERLSDAQRNGHRVLAVIRGSAINQDGRSNGPTAPNGPAQEAVIREALRRGGVAPSRVGYLECHGTGTPLGDPIEVQAAAAVLGEGRTADAPLVLGSLKSNIGHAEGAAGIGGLIKAVLTLRHGRIPASLHFNEPNPHIAWSELPVRVASEAIAWPRTDRPRVAGVSSFGISGTNAHVVLEEAPAAEEHAPAPQQSAELVVLSAKSSEALSATAGRLAEHLERHAEQTLGDVAYSLATTRTYHEHRLSLTARSREELIHALQEARRGEVPSGSTRGEARSGGTAWLFTGQGSQRVGMGKELAEAWPVFREALAEAMRALDAHLDVPLREVMWAPAGTEAATRLGATEYAQPALFALGVGLAALWRSWGVRPDYVMGHSVGELTAAHVAGVLTLSDAAKLVAARGRLMQRLPEAGAMLSLAAPEAEVAKALAGSEATVAIAAVNGPESTVISGAEDAVMRIAEGFASRGIRTKRLEVSHAFHSPLMDPMLEEFRRVAESVQYGRAEMPLVSNVSGRVSTGEVSTAAYWVGHVRAAVRFADGVQTLQALGVRRYVELGAKATLLGLVSSCVAASEPEELLLVPSLRAERSEDAAALDALGALHAHGASVDFQGVFPSGGRRVELPTYAWQRQRYWLERRSREEESSVAELERLSNAGALSESARAALPEVLSALRSERAKREVSAWFYALAWRRAALRGGANASGRWLVLDDGSGLAGALSNALTRAGADAEVVDRPWGENLRSSLKDTPARVVLCASTEGIEVEAIDALRACEASEQAEPTCWVLTRGAVSADGEELTSPSGAVLWGMGKSFGLEHPRRWGGLVDVGTELGEEEASRAVAWIGGEAEAQGEEHLAVRKEGDWVQRLVRRGVPEPKGKAWSTAGAALVTGGLGRIGLQVARWLVSRGVKHVIVTGRRGLRAPGAEAAVAELRALGAEITVGEVDVADLGAMKAFAATLTSPVTAIFHAAGVLDDATPFLKLNGERLGRVLSAKREGTLVLEELSRAWPLDAFVCFSSGAGVWGFGGTSAYAGANAYLDAWAEAARRRGVPATSIAWGMWSGTASEEKHERWLERRGMRAMPVEGALLAMERVLLSGLVQGVVADIEWTAFRKGYESWRRRALLLELEGAEAAGSTPETKERESAWRSELLLLPEQKRREVVLEAVRGEVARVLAMPNASSVPADRPLKELGLDSLMAVELRNTLGKRAGTRLPATLVFDYPNPAAIATHLLEKVLCVVEASPKATAPVAIHVVDEPIAIVGLGCRYPGGVEDARSFWRLLDEGIDAVTEAPSARWDVEDPETQENIAARWGGFLNGVDRFEPVFFGISPREAVTMDPQQRLLLETSWEALESAGITPASLLGSSTGVFVGIGAAEYAARAAQDATDGYPITGNSASVASGRISYTFGLQGPSMTVDTACSSSLVAVHLASQSLRSGECTLALAGGVNVTVTREATAMLGRFQALSPTGRCHTFSAEADGYVRSEGAGVVVLERLSDARRNGHRVLGLIRASAVNQDGRSNGLTAPNGPAQEAVIREALRKAGVAPSSVGYLECHGTGTALGDPLEVQAAAAVFGEGRRKDDPLLLGALKSNIGHAEAASGVGGLIKTVLALKHERIPKTLHFKQPNPHVPWSELSVKVASEPVPWPRGEKARFAGVSSFGISGTNAHVVLEEAPVEEGRASAPSPRAELVVLSAKTIGALEEGAGRLVAHMEAHPELEVGDLAWNLATTRTHHEERLTLPILTRAELVEALKAASRGERVEWSGRGTAHSGARVVFVFPGAGSQWVGMGLELLATEPVFRRSMEACEQAIAAETGWSVIEELRRDSASTRIEHVEVVQPALFAVHVSLAALWRSWGVEPSVVVGHSQGEIAAAVVSGALTLEEGAKVVSRRSGLLRNLAGRGEMALVQLSLPETEAALKGYEAEVSVAASNSRRSTVISGGRAALGEVLGKLESRGVYCKRVKVDFASHSPQVEALRDGLIAALRGVDSAQTQIPMVSTVTCAPVGEGELSGDYWADNLRKPVRLAEVVEGLLAEGPCLFVEVSAHPVLLPALEELRSEHAPAHSNAGEGPATQKASMCPQKGPPAGAVVGSLYRERGERHALLSSLGELYVHGARINWPAVCRGDGRRVELPTYAWQRQRYWLESRVARVQSGDATGHALLGVRLSVAGADGSAVYEPVVSRSEEGWLYEHEVGDHVLMPGAALVELLRAAGEDFVGGEPVEVRSVAFESPLELLERGGQRVQVVVKEEEGRIEATVYSRRAGGDGARAWARHASGAVHRMPVADVPDAEPYEALRARCTDAEDVEAVYETFATAGLRYGPVFRGLRALWRGVGEAVGEVSLPEEVEVEGYGVHPALLDAAFHAMAGLSAQEEEGKARLPFSMDRYVVHGAGSRTARVHVRRGSSGGVDVRVVDVEGRCVAEVLGLRTRSRQESATSETDALYVVKWKASVSSSSSAPLGGRWAVVGPRGDALADGVVDRLSSMGVEAVERLDVSGLAAGAEAAEHVVCVWGGSASETDAESALRVAREGLSVVQALARRAGTDGKSRRMWWVTRGAVSTVAAEGAKAALAPLWGLGRTVMAEHPELGCRLVDVDAESLRRGVDAIVRELGEEDEESQVAWRDGERRVARLEHAPREAVSDAESYRLEIGAKGSLDELKLVGCARRAPGAGEVEIEVRATGLNFRDVVSTLGMEATAGFEGSLEAPLGGECSGVVVAVGAGVTRFGVGDEVMALASGSFSRFVTTDARVVARMPTGLSYAQAAGIPVAFLTAWYGLFDLGGLKAGERVLVHAAAGGVGMAAVQLAKRIGAEVYGTASSGKWEAVKAQGVAHVASSRDLGFASSIREASGGRGVDVVLNSLSGEFVDESLSLLSRGGRFIEMGKTDVRDASAMGTKYPGTSYRAFDLMEAGPARLGEMLASVAEALAKGDLRPLPIETFTVTEAERAFRWMAQARHVGKIVLTAARRLRTDGAVLITGGLGVLGLHAARVLVEGGVKHLVLVGRRGVETPGAAEAIASLEAEGAHVTVASVDVTDRAGLAALLEGLPSSVPLRGVVHTAGALDDGVLSEQTPERFARVLAPKVLGSWHLHELTKDKELDVFVLYSSASGTLGNGGQGPYAAANVFLDALASSRRAAGLAGQSIAWGLWVDESQRAAGLAAHLGDAHAGSTSSWMGAITPALGARLLRSLLGREESEIAAVPVKLAALSKAFGDSVPALWRSLVTKRTRRATAGTWARELSLLPPEQREEAIVAAVRAEVARVLSLPSASSVPVDRPLKELGLDSLMAVELRNALGRRVGATLPATLAFDHPTPARIADYLGETVLRGSAARRPEPSTPERRELRVEDVASLSDDELVARMEAELAAFASPEKA